MIIDLPLTFLIVFAENILPVLMPPTWLILAVIYNLNSKLDPLILAAVGTVASTSGRYILTRLSTKFRDKFIDNKQIKKMKEIGRLAKENPVKAFFIVLGLSAITPLPSGALFIVVGFSEAVYWSVFLGFMIGRFIQYYVMIISFNFVFTSIAGVLGFNLLNTIILDIIAIILIIIFMMIDWVEFIHSRKIRFIKFRLLAKKKR